VTRLSKILAALTPFVFLVANAGTSAATTSGGATVPRYDHIFVIVEENHGFGDVIGNPAAPNLNALANTFGLATQYYGVSHPSEPNYVGLLGGSTFGISSDDPYYINRVDAPSLITQLDRAGISWKAYLQGLPHPGYQDICYPAKCNGTPDVDPLYASKHDAIQNFTTSLNPTDWSRQVPVGQLFGDLASGNVPRFDYVIPDECHDMHGDPPFCIDGGDPGDPQDQHLVGIGDAYLGNLVSHITGAPFWSQGNNAIAIVYDEGDFNRGCCGANPGGGRVASIIVTSHGPRGLKDPTPYNHYSLLQTIQRSLGLGCLQHTCDTSNVTSMTPLFQVTGSAAIATSTLPIPKMPTPTPTRPEPIGKERFLGSSGGWSAWQGPTRGSDDNSLGGISGSDAGAWAVGNFIPDTPTSNPDATLTLAERFDGSTWTPVPTPNPGPNFATLFGVAKSGDRAWAVGVSQNASYRDRALIESWDGGAWSVDRVPQPAPLGDMLWGASAVSANDVWAVGSRQGPGERFSTLIEHFNGGSWSVVPSPNPGSSGNALYAVTAIGPRDVWAVGQELGAHGPDHGLVEHWDGDHWSATGTPSTGDASVMLDGVTSAGGHVWAVGNRVDAVSGSSPFGEVRRNGAWRVVALPHVASAFTTLWGVTSSAGSPWVVGSYQDVAGNQHTLMIRRQDQWRIVNVPNPGSGDNILGGISPTSAGLISVGTFDDGGPNLPLIERRLG